MGVPQDSVLDKFLFAFTPNQSVALPPISTSLYSNMPITRNFSFQLFADTHQSSFSVRAGFSDVQDTILKISFS
jgi:hypothetical protein